MYHQVRHQKLGDPAGNRSLGGPQGREQDTLPSHPAREASRALAGVGWEAAPVKGRSWELTPATLLGWEPSPAGAGDLGLPSAVAPDKKPPSVGKGSWDLALTITQAWVPP